MIRVIEELSMNAWPALQTLLYDGWVLRFADGYTRRANSINPIYPSSDDVGDKIRTCESLYHDRGLKVVFKITSAVYPEGLDGVLANQGYAVDAQTSVQILDLGRLGQVSTPEAALTESLSDDWLSAFCEMSGIPAQRAPLLSQMLHSIAPATCFAAIRHGDRAIACGLGVVQAGFVGLFDIVTHPQARRQGYGTQLVSSILAWARQRGAHSAYLQVMLNNPPALHLYSKLGFGEIYQYWYRVKPLAG
jgi:ribosomal protein S18 acetylase RimI-like enzyme